MRKILSRLQKCIVDYNLIEDGDKIAIGLSGGKDSIVLLEALNRLQKFYSKKFEIIGITVDLTNGKQDWSSLTQHCELIGVKHIVVKSNVFEVVFEERKEKNPCSLCAKMRRGILNQTASKEGCNKVALAHHADDLIETFFLSMLYEGRLSTFWPMTYLSNTNIMVIRPLIYARESEVTKASRGLPIIKNICPVDKHTKREEIKSLIKQISKDISCADERILSSILNEDRYNLFDKAKNFIKNQKK